MNRFIKLTSLGLLAILPLCIAPQVIQMKTGGQSRVWQIAGHDVLRSFNTKELGRKVIPADAPSIIFQDPTGIFWFGGAHGLCTYGEKEDRWMDRSAGVDGNGSLMWIHALTADKQGRIWACHGFANKRIAFLAGGQWRDANELRPSNITSLGRTLIAGQNGRIWFASPQGVIGYDGRRWMGPFNPPEMMVQTYNQFKLIYSDKNRADLANIRERMRRRYGEGEPRPPPWTSEVYSGIQDRDGDIWLGATRGIWRFEERTGSWRVYPTHGLAEEVSLIDEDRYGRIWFADSDAHLALYDKHKGQWTSYDLGFEDAVVEALYVDKQGKVMIGAELGIIILDERTRETRSFTVHLGTNLVQGISAIAEDNQGRIWIGTPGAILVLKE